MDDKPKRRDPDRDRRSSTSGALASEGVSELDESAALGRYRDASAIGTVAGHELIAAHMSLFEAVQRDGPHLDARAIVQTIAARYPESAELATRVYFRLMALIKVLDHPPLRPWIVNRIETGSALMDPVLFEIAAVHPLPRESLTFEPETFCKAVLARAETSGSS
jgi:hypothetical protein